MTVKTHIRRRFQHTQLFTSSSERKYKPFFRQTYQLVTSSYENGRWCAWLQEIDDPIDIREECSPLVPYEIRL